MTNVTGAVAWTFEQSSLDARRVRVTGGVVVAVGLFSSLGAGAAAGAGNLTLSLRDISAASVACDDPAAVIGGLLHHHAGAARLSDSSAVNVCQSAPTGAATNGVIWIDGGFLALRNVTVVGTRSSYGALTTFGAQARVTVDRCSFVGGRGVAFGAAITAQLGGSVIVRDSLFLDNRDPVTAGLAAIGAVHVTTNATMELHNCTLRGTRVGLASGRFRAVGCLFVANNALIAGAVYAAQNDITASFGTICRALL